MDHFIREMNHQKGDDDIIERSGKNAYILDGEDGIAAYLNFRDGEIPIADFYHRCDDVFQIIELSDLEKQIKECLSVKEKIINEKKLNGTFKLKDIKEVRRIAWAPITNEIKRKWCGSIAVIERLLRKNIETHCEPVYKLTIVCRNHTDPRILDELALLLKGMIPSIVICRTDSINLHS